MSIPPSDILPPTNPRDPGSRAKAQRVRAKVTRNTATPEEIEWINEYDSRKERPPRGASAHRKVTHVEEESAAMGEGDASLVAANAAFAREDGRREDNLADRGIRALERAFSRQEKLVEFMMSRMQMLEDSHLGMWAAHRDSRIRETDAEIALMKREAEDDGKEDQVSALAAELLPHLLKQLKGAGK